MHYILTKKREPRFDFVIKVKKKTFVKFGGFFLKKNLLRCILPPIKNICQILLQLFTLWLLWLQFKTKNKTNPDIYIYYKNKKQNVMSRFRSKIKGLVYCTTITEQNIHTYVTQSKNLLMYLFLYITDTKFVLDSFFRKRKHFSIRSRQRIKKNIFKKKNETLSYLIICVVR